MPGRAATPLSDREVAELRAVPDAKTAGEAKASSSAGRGNSATVPDPGGPPSPTAGRRRKAPAQSLPAGSLSLFSRPDARATAPPPLPPPQQPGVEPDWPGSQVFGFGYNAHGQLGCGDTRARATPQLLRELGSISLTSLACGSGHSVAIDAARPLFGAVGGAPPYSSNTRSLSPYSPLVMAVLLFWVRCHRARRQAHFWQRGSSASSAKPF